MSDRPVLNREGIRGQRTCTACGHANRAAASFCAYCGVRLPATLQCGRCGEECDNGQRYCHACGSPLAGGGPQATERAGEEVPDGGIRGMPASDSSAQRGWRALLGSTTAAFQESALGRLVGTLVAPGPFHSADGDDPWVQGGRPEAGGAVFLEQIAHLGDAATVRANVLWGVLAVAGAVGGKWLLGQGHVAAAVVLFGVAVIAGLWAFRRSTEFALPALGDHKQLKRLNPLWLLAVVLIPGALAA